MRKQIRFSLVFVLVLVSLLVLLNFGVSVSAQEKECPIEVMPGEWKSTGIMVRKDQQISVEATGLFYYKDHRNEMTAKGDMYGTWRLVAKIGDKTESVGEKWRFYAEADGVLQFGAPVRENLPITQGIESLDLAMSKFCVKVTVSGGIQASTVRIKTTKSCTPEENERATAMGNVSFDIGGKALMTDANGDATIALAPGEYAVNVRTRNDAVLGFVHQSGTLFRGPEVTYKIDVSKSQEAVEIRMIYCDEKGQRYKRATITEIGGRMRVRVPRIDGGGAVSQPATVGLVLRDGDILDVDGTGKLTWMDGGIITFLDPKRSTTIVIGPVRPGGTPEGISLLRGLINFWFDPATSKKRGFRFEAGSDSVFVGVKGTVFSMAHDELSKMSTVSVQEGDVEITPRNPSLAATNLRAGQQVEVSQTAVRLIGPKTAGPIAQKTAGPPGQKTGEPSWTGTWLFRGIAGQRCSIVDMGNGLLKVVTEKGVVGEAYLDTPTTIAVEYPTADDVVGRRSVDGNRIDWSNGEFWTRPR